MFNYKRIHGKEVKTYGIHTGIITNGQCHLAEVGMVSRKTYDRDIGDPLGDDRKDDGGDQTWGGM